jgi:uracil-DNA glycosylase family 4
MVNDILEQLEKANTKLKRIAGPKQFCYGRFLPNTKVMFIAEMPTPDPHWNPRNNFFISWTDKDWVEILNENGFGGCYVTDIVKVCSKARRPKKDEIQKFKSTLLQEIETIKPELIVAIGKSAFNILQKYFCEEISSDRVYKTYLWHPANLRRPKRRQTIKHQIKQLRSFCSGL